MNHLTDEQLVLWLYEQTSQGTIDPEHHLESCDECRERFQRLEATKNQLDLFVVPAREFEIDVRSALSQQPATFQTVPLRSYDHRRFPVSRLVMAASLALFIGGLCFLLGAVSQARQMRFAVRDQVASALHEREQRDQAQWQQRDAQINRRLEEHVASLRELFADLEGRDANQSLVALRNIQMQFQRLLNAHFELRKDLQTLAVNAESELRLTQEDIRRIDQFVSYFVPKNN